MLHENDSDRSNQAYVADQVLMYLDSQPITGVGLDGISYWVLAETLQELAESHDYDLRHHGRYVGVLEVKCREGRYTKEYFDENGVMMETGLLNEMRVKHHHNGRHVLFAIRSSDMVIFIVSLMTMLKNRKLFVDAPDGSTKDNHGQNDVNRSAVYVPLSLFTEI